MTIGQFLQNEILKMQWLERLAEKAVALTGLDSSSRIGGSVTFSFLISSPMVDIGSLIILMSIFGWKVAVTYVILGLLIAIIGGRIIENLNMEDQVEEFIRSAGFIDTQEEKLSFRHRLIYSKIRWSRPLPRYSPIF